MKVAVAIYDEKHFEINVLGIFNSEDESSIHLLNEAREVARAHGLSAPQNFEDDAFEMLRDIGWRFEEHDVEIVGEYSDRVYVVTSYAYKWCDLEAVRIFAFLEDAQEYKAEVVREKLGAHTTDDCINELSEKGYDIEISEFYFGRGE